MSIQLKRGTALKWKEENVVLKAGQVGIESESRRLKIGDGVTAWNDLKFATSPIVELNRAPASSDNGYEIGQFWKDTSEARGIYVLVGLSEGEASWKRIVTAGDVVETAEQANKLSAERAISFSGDASGSGSFDGSKDISVGLTLNDTDITPGTYTKVTFDSKGRATSGTQATKSDIGLGNVDNVQQASKAEFEANKLSVQNDIARAEAIAKGASRAKVFATVAELEAWLSVQENTNDLQIGDNFYIVDRNVPDYWWDGTQKQELETQKVDLSDYPKTAEVQAMLAAEVDRLTTEINKKAPNTSPTLTGTPKAPTATAGTNTTQVATTAFVHTALENLDDGDIG